MQATTDSPVTNLTTAVTKSREQILIQSSGAMIAIIVIGIIIILSILLIILKTYNKRMHTKSLLSGSSSKPRKSTPSTTTMTTLQMQNIRGSTSFMQNGTRFPRAEVSSIAEQASMHSGSTVATIHSTPSMENT